MSDGSHPPTDYATRLAGCTQWQWMPGTHVRTKKGNEKLLVHGMHTDECHGGPRVLCWRRDELAPNAGYTIAMMPTCILPDLDDPATVGWLRKMFLGATKGRCVDIRYERNASGHFVLDIRVSYRTLAYEAGRSEGVTLARALVQIWEAQEEDE